jgi:hypothetical protein
LAKATLVASAKAVLTTIAAESTIFLVVSITISFLLSSAVFAVSATAKQRGPNRHV